jgi:hypothetical protein
MDDDQPASRVLEIVRLLGDPAQQVRDAALAALHALYVTRCDDDG